MKTMKMKIGSSLISLKKQKKDEISLLIITIRLSKIRHEHNLVLRIEMTY